MLRDKDDNGIGGGKEEKKGRMRRVGVCFDIDGVLVRGGKRLAGARSAVQAIAQAGCPFVFMTNGGGYSEAKKARQLEELLGVDGIREQEQILLAHTPMKNLVHGCTVPEQPALQDKRVMVLGCRDEINVAKSYGFRKVVSPQEFWRQHPDMYLFRQPPEPPLVEDPFKHEAIQAILVMHDPTDWHLELQVCMDILLGKDPLHGTHPSPVQTVPVYNSNEDFVYACKYKHPRFAQGAFLHTLSNLFALSSGGQTLDVVRYGKPHKVTFDYARMLLETQTQGEGDFDKIFMVGDNVHADIKGANDAGEPWHSILVETGVFQTGMDDLGARTKVPDVRHAVDFILKHL